MMTYNLKPIQGPSLIIQAPSISLFIASVRSYEHP